MVVRRILVGILAVCALLWGVTGVSALAIAAHEHVHHTEGHDHHEDLEAALHGHAHEGVPDHDHDLTASPIAPRAAAPGSGYASGSQPLIPAPDQPGEGLLTSTSVGWCSSHGAPPFLMFCALLT
jgi:hypothetical protein